jgi:hypothetical protein
MTHNVPDAAVTIYRWNGVSTAPCGYVVGRTIYDTTGRATHTIDPGEGGSGTVRDASDVVVMTVCDNWFYIDGVGVAFVDMNDPRPWRTSGTDGASAWLPQEGV